MIKLAKISLLPILLVLLLSVEVWGFGEIVGACESDCMKCHSITLEEAAEMVDKLNPEIEVMEIKLGPVGGLWELVIKARGKKGVAYVDFSKRHIITGNILEVDSKENLTERRLYELSRIDVSSIPLGNALVLGDIDAEYRAIVFADPD
jgi:thiol:disulfide interchange protein DsbC